MPMFSAADGTRLCYHVSGTGAPVVCLPGGPMQSTAYLGNLGGLSDHRQLIMLDLRGTGDSAVPEDPASYRCDRQVDDVEALRNHLNLDRLTLLAHCAGTNLAVLYAAKYPERIAKLLLITPSPAAVGITITAQTRREIVQTRRNEPWFAEASAAFERVAAGNAEPGDPSAIAPFFYGRWSPAAQAHQARGTEQRNPEAAAGYGTEGAYHPETTRAALATFQPPVLLLAGEVDLNTPPSAVTEFASLFPNPTLTVQPGASHHPWLDDPTWFTKTVISFLS